jgi:hypothetical protein
MKFEIKNRWNGEIIFSVEAENWKFAVEAAIKAKANLRYANLTSANLTSANLTSANLRYANLRYANLTSANLRYANLRSANLTSADLSDIRNDFWSVLLFARKEVKALRKAIVDGKIDGSVYAGECACLVGTIAKARKCDYKTLKGNLQANSSRPAERFFMAIKAGETPDTNPAAKVALEWLDEFVKATK